MSGRSSRLFIFMKYGLFLVLLIILVSFLGYYFLRENIHTIIPNAYYRSAQLDAAELSRVIKKRHIQTVISLRQPDSDKKWYQQELKVTQVLGVKHYDVGMQAYVLPNPQTLRRLANLLETAPKPILIHCQGGADRTGLASAFVLLLDNVSLAKAKKQISFRFFVIYDDSVGLLVLPYYQKWLKRRHLTSSRHHFLTWLQTLHF